MTEILTESFCERCGTRYTFETKAARSGRGRGFKTLSAGLKNFVLSDDTSLGDALAAARSEQDREVTNQQLDAFHKTFNFCMQCRQYTCANCWNEGEGFCLTCAPHLGHEIMPAPFPGGAATIDTRESERTSIAASAWPALDLSPVLPEVEARIADLAGEVRDDVDAAPTEPPAWPERTAPGPAEAAAEGGRDTASAAPPGLSWPDDIAASATAQTRSGLDRSRVPGPDGSAQPADTVGDVAAPDERVVADESAAGGDLMAPAPPPWIELEPGAMATDAGGDAVAGVSVAPTEDAAPPAEHVADDAAPAEPVADHAAPAERDVSVAPAEEVVPIEAVVEGTSTPGQPAPTGPLEAEHSVPTRPLESEQPAAASRPRPPEDVVSQPVWRIVAPDEPSVGAPGPNGQPTERPLVPPPSAEPQWPTASTDRLEFLRRPRPAGDVWTASTQDLLAQPPPPAAGSAGPVAIQACTSCGLSLSATARFCRRCGTRQG